MIVGKSNIATKSARVDVRGGLMMAVCRIGSTYKSLKYIEVESCFLGWMKLGLMTAIAIYVIVFEVYLNGGYAKCEHPTAGSMLNLVPPIISTDINLETRCQNSFNSTRRVQVDNICDKTKLYNFADKYETSFVRGAFETIANEDYDVSNLTSNTDGGRVFTCGSLVTGKKCSGIDSTAVILGEQVTKEDCRTLCSSHETRLYIDGQKVEYDAAGRRLAKYIDDGTLCCEYSSKTCYACDSQCTSSGSNSLVSAATCAEDYELFDRLVCRNTALGSSYTWGDNVFHEVPDFIEVATIQQAVMGLPVLTDLVDVATGKVATNNGHFQVDSLVYGYVEDLLLTINFNVVSSFSDYLAEGAIKYQGTENELVVELLDQDGEVVEMCAQNTATYDISDSVCNLDDSSTYQTTDPCRFERVLPEIPIKALFAASGIRMDEYNDEWFQQCTSQYFNRYLGAYVLLGQKGLEKANMFFHANASRFTSFDKFKAHMLASGLELACRYAAIPRFGTTLYLNMVYKNLGANGAESITVQMNVVAEPSFLRERGQSQYLETGPINTGTGVGNPWRSFTSSRGIAIKVLHDGTICGFDFPTLLLTLTSALGLLALTTTLTDIVMMHADPLLWKIKYEHVDTRGHHVHRLQHHRSRHLGQPTKETPDMQEQHVVEFLRQTKHHQSIAKGDGGRTRGSEHCATATTAPTPVLVRQGSDIVVTPARTQQMHLSSTPASLSDVKVKTPKRSRTMATCSKRVGMSKSHHRHGAHHQSNRHSKPGLATAAISSNNSAPQVQHKHNFNKHKRHRDESGKCANVNYDTAADHGKVAIPRIERKPRTKTHRRRRSKSPKKAVDANRATSSSIELQAIKVDVARSTINNV